MISLLHVPGTCISTYTVGLWITNTTYRLALLWWLQGPSVHIVTPTKTCFSWVAMVFSVIKDSFSHSHCLFVYRYWMMVSTGLSHPSCSKCLKLSFSGLAVILYTTTTPRNNGSTTSASDFSLSLDSTLTDLAYRSVSHHPQQ